MTRPDTWRSGLPSHRKAPACRSTRPLRPIASLGRPSVTRPSLGIILGVLTFRDTRPNEAEFGVSNDDGTCGGQDRKNQLVLHWERSCRPRETSGVSRPEPGEMRRDPRGLWNPADLESNLLVGESLPREISWLPDPMGPRLLRCTHEGGVFQRAGELIFLRRIRRGGAAPTFSAGGRVPTLGDRR